MLIRITAPHFVAGFDTDSGLIAPIISYMRLWTLDTIMNYCNRKHWTVEIF